MGVLSIYLANICCIVLASIALPFCLWTLHFVYQNASAVTKAEKQRRRSKPERNDVLCSIFFKQCTTVQFIMAVTVSSVACLTICELLMALGSALHIAICLKCQPRDVPKAATVCYELWFFFWLFGYFLLCVTHFERLRLTFKDTTRRLPKWAPRLLYAWLSLTMFFGTVAAALYTWPIVSGISAIISVLIYLAGVSALAHAFFSKTMAVARNTERVDEELVNTALRVTVSVTLSLASTTLYVLIYGVVSLLFNPMRRPLWILILVGFGIFDSVLNVFCLMCTLRKAQPYYFRVFGGLHSFLLTHVSAVDCREDANSAVNSVASDTTQGRVSLSME